MKSKINQLKAGVILSYATMAVQSLIAIAYTPVMLRLLGKSEYGVYNLVYSVVSYLGLLSFGFGSAYMRFYSRYQTKHDEDNIARLNGMFISIFSVIALIALAAGAILTMNSEALFSGGLTEHEIHTAKILMELMVFNIAVSFPASVFDSIVTAHEQYIFQRIINLLRTVLNPFLTLPLLLMGYKSISLVVVTTFLTLASFAVNAWFCFIKIKTRFIFNNFNFILLKEIWLFSFYIFLNMLTDQANWSVDKIILGKMKGSSDVAVYSIGAQFNTLYLSFSTAISSVFIPKVNRIVAENDDNNTLTDLFARVGRVQFLVLSFILTGFIFFGEYFIKVWAGKEYATSYITAYHVALWLMIPVTVPLIQNLGLEIQKAKNMHKFRSVIYALITVANVIISVLLCPSFGAIGCAIGTAIALIVGNGFIMNWYYYKRVKLNLYHFWKQILEFAPAFILPCAVGGVMKYLLGIDSVLKFVGLGLIYALVFAFSMWSFGMNNSEKQLFKAPFIKIRSYFVKKEM
ncbi:lipopolysaccharide biosynthesis protein [Caproiciproducens faecalis]|uniref:Polysaccharide biosynthesis protein n=1 Tax=Caproiciproducens faecalis TaxID=2820301 RepID=A0ABS7DLP3_9FIRM|nr:oligosaccharide flippase family protein [Caproiciproducens faecalis]MBW7571982.1 polysaccharide biosynthesis protein [Caproiciproducens faecalis]